MLNISSFSVPKTVVSSGPNLTSSSDIAVLVIQNSGNLALFKPGDEKWTLSDDSVAPFDDIINFKGKFYAVDRAGRLIMLACSLEGMEIVLALTSSGKRKHLVESSGDLFLVDRYIENEDNLMVCKDVFGFIEEPGLNFTYHFDIFKLNEQEHSWVVVESLPDRVLFVGDHCFSVAAKEFHGSNGNLIYFRDGYYAATRRVYVQPKGLYGHDTCVFTLENGGIGPLDAFPGYADMYWPPPS